MALIEHDLFRGRIDRVQVAIDRLKMFEPEEGYYLAYSGGKDSDTILALANGSLPARKPQGEINSFWSYMGLAL